MLYFWIKTSLGVLLTVNFFLPFYTVVSNRHLHDEPMAVLAGNLSLNGMLLGLTSAVTITTIGAYELAQLQWHGLSFHFIYLKKPHTGK